MVTDQSFYEELKEIDFEGVRQGRMCGKFPVVDDPIYAVPYIFTQQRKSSASDSNSGYYCGIETPNRQKTQRNHCTDVANKPCSAVVPAPYSIEGSINSNHNGKKKKIKKRGRKPKSERVPEVMKARFYSSSEEFSSTSCDSWMLERNFSGHQHQSSSIMPKYTTMPENQPELTKLNADVVLARLDRQIAELQVQYMVGIDKENILDAK